MVWRADGRCVAIAIHTPRVGVSVALERHFTDSCCRRREQSRGEVNGGWSAYRVCFPYMHHFPESLVRGKRRGPDQGGPS